MIVKEKNHENLCSSTMFNSPNPLSANVNVRLIFVFKEDVNKNVLSEFFFTFSPFLFLVCTNNEGAWCRT